MRRALAALAVASTLALSGCSGLEGTQGLEYVAGDGRVLLIPTADRGEPVQASGTTIDGQPLDVADYRGRALVANVWASWCGPCRKEMPLLAEVDAALPSDAAMIGLNTRESSDATAAALVRTSGVSFPSLNDDGGTLLLAFSDKLGGPEAVPTTMVLDREGRLAALISGAVPSRTTLLNVVDDVLGDPS